MLVFASQLLSFSESKDLLNLLTTWTFWYSTTTWHWCHSFQLFSLPVSFNSGSEVAIGLTFILSFFFLSLSVFFKAAYFTEFSVFWRFLHYLAFSLVCSFFFLTLSASLSATLSGLLCHSDDFLLSSVKQLLLYYIYGLAQYKQVTCMKVIC